MKNKKYLVSAGIAAAALAVGGTAAFFTSSDMISNPFATGTTDDREDPNAGIDAIEDFYGPQWDGEKYVETQFDDNPNGYGEQVSGPTQVLPGQVFNKQMKVVSTAQYPQYLRVSLMVTVNLPGQEEVVVNLPAQFGAGVFDPVTMTLTYGELEITLDPTVLTEWSPDSDYFYYDFILAPGAHTNDIVKAVRVLPTAGNEWKNATFDIDLYAESIQATEDAWVGEWMKPAPAPTLLP